MIEEEVEIFEEDHGPSVEELDDEMQVLLGKLEDDNPDLVADKMEGVIPTSGGRPVDVSPPLQLTPNVDPPEKNKLPDVSELKSEDVRRVDSLPMVKVAEPVQVAEPPIVDVRKQFEQMDAITDEILQGTRADRQEAQDAITLLRSEIDKSIAAGHNPSRMYVDNLVKALEVKTTINMTAVKIMEAKAKLLAATKAGIVVQTNNQINNANVQGGTDQSLMDALSDPLGPNDEY